MPRGLATLRERFDAILLDLDGTLLDGQGQLTERTTAAVRRLVDAGMLVILCTGRSVAGTQPIHEALDLDTPFVSYNGSWIGGDDGIPVHYLPIPDEHVGCLAVMEQEARFTFRHANEQKFTVLSAHPEHTAVANWYQHVIHAEDHAELPQEGLMRISLFFEDQDCIDTAWSRMGTAAQAALHREVFPLSLFDRYADSRLVLCEVQRRTRGKAEAIHWLGAERGIPARRIIAVGDHLNDLTMLDAAGLAVSPANAHPEAARRADIRIGHHREDGLAAWIESGAPLTGTPASEPRP